MRLQRLLTLCCLQVQAEDCVSSASLLQRHTNRDHDRVVWLSAISLASGCDSEGYLEEYAVALRSWQETRNTLSFNPHLVLHLDANATRNSLASSLQTYLRRIEHLGAKLIFHRLSFLEKLKEQSLPDEVHRDELECMAGAFIRLEIPRLELPRSRSELLYTDCDVIWWRHISLQEWALSMPRQPFSLAYSGQLSKDEGPLNDGVMLINLDSYERDMPKVIESITESPRFRCDQRSINDFYEAHPGRALWSIIWNYRMYWDGHEPVAMVHYWGVKPSELKCWLQGQSCPTSQSLLPREMHNSVRRMALDMAVLEDPELRFLKESLRSHLDFLLVCLKSFFGFREDLQILPQDIAACWKLYDLCQ